MVLLGIGWSRELDEPLDGIVYGTAVDFGFASVEHVIYASGAIEAGAAHAAYLRGFTVALVHVSTSGALEFSLGLTRFRSPKRPRLVTTGLLMAIGFHGACDPFL